MQNMAASLIAHEIIQTTVPKAKELRRELEPLITRAKDDSLHTYIDGVVKFERKDKARQQVSVYPKPVS